MFSLHCLFCLNNTNPWYFQPPPLPPPPWDNGKSKNTPHFNGYPYPSPGDGGLVKTTSVLVHVMFIQYNLSNPACYQTEKKTRIRQGTGIERLTYPRDIKLTLVSIQHTVDNGYVNELYTQIYSRLKKCFNFLSTNKTFKNKISVFVVYTYVSPSCIYIHALVLTSLK